MTRALTARELGMVLDEVAPEWTGAQVQKLRMRGPRVALLSLRRPGRSGVLTVSVEPEAAGLCVSEAAGPTEAEPSAFCMLLRRLLRGRGLASLRQLGGDRVVELRGPGGGLVAEMTGRTGCLVALDAAGLVVSVSAPAGRPRAGLDRGRAYEPPPAGGGAADEPAPRAPAGGANALACELLGARAAEGAADERLRLAAGRGLRARLRKARRAIAAVEGDLARLGEAAALERRGELLKASLGQVRRGMSSVVVPDWFGQGEPVEIPLDPARDPVANLERIFKRARKARRAAEAGSARLEALRAEAAGLEAALAALERAEGAALRELARGSGAEPGPALAPARRAPRPVRLPYNELRDLRGRPILVGRSAADNDALTAEVARPGDLWLHARGFRGSHVVVPLDRGEQVEPDRLVDAATLAAHFSEARGEPTVEVAYTPRRYVRKPRGAPPGEVVLQREKVIVLRVEADRLARLLGGPRS